MAEEGLKKTKNELIHIGCPIPFDTEEFLHQLTVLMKAAYDNAGFFFKLKEHVIVFFSSQIATRFTQI